MPSQSLIPLTDKPGDFSAGASATDSTTPWNLGPYLEAVREEDGKVVLSFAREFPEGFVLHTVSLNSQQTGGEMMPVLPLAGWQRILSHVLVNQIPDEGLGEVCENLRNAWDFYRLRPSPPPLPAVVHAQPAQLAGAYERPVFQASEE